MHALQQTLLRLTAFTHTPHTSPHILVVDHIHKERRLGGQLVAQDAQLRCTWGPVGPGGGRRKCESPWYMVGSFCACPCPSYHPQVSAPVTGGWCRRLLPAARRQPQRRRPPSRPPPRRHCSRLCPASCWPRCQGACAGWAALNHLHAPSSLLEAGQLLYVPLQEQPWQPWQAAAPAAAAAVPSCCVQAPLHRRRRPA